MNWIEIIAREVNEWMNAWRKLRKKILIKYARIVKENKKQRNACGCFWLGFSVDLIPWPANRAPTHAIAIAIININKKYNSSNKIYQLHMQ